MDRFKDVLQIGRKKKEKAEATPASVALAKSKRRTFLKYALLGGGVFVAGKVLGPSITFFGDSFDFGKVVNFENFRVVEKNGILSFFDRFGNEILVLDKGE